MSRGLVPLTEPLVCVLVIVYVLYLRAVWRVGGPRVRDRGRPRAPGSQGSSAAARRSRAHASGPTGAAAL